MLLLPLNVVHMVGIKPTIHKVLLIRRRGARAGVSADDGKDQQHFEQSLGKRTEKKEKEIVLVVCLVISSHV
jgi:hypothetical protein